MKIIYNYFLPFPGYAAMMLFARIFARMKFKAEGLSAFIIQHEAIHHLQALDYKREGEGGDTRAYLRFYWSYFLQWLKYGYRNCPFEREAADMEGVPGYLETREPNAWKWYLNNALGMTRSIGAEVDPIIERIKIKTAEYLALSA